MSEPAFDVVRLAVGSARGGVELANYDEFDLSIDMRAPGSPWTFSFWRTDTSPRAAERWRELLFLCKQGETVRIAIDGATQLVGLIDSVEVVTEASQVLVISGRDFASRAMDADADPTLSVKGMLLPEALQALMGDCWSQPLVLVDGARQAEVQGRPARARADRTTGRRRRRSEDGDDEPREHRARTKKVDPFKISAGDKVWDVAQQIVRRLGLMLWTAPAEGTAGLVVDVPVASGEALYTLDRRQVAGRELAGVMLRSHYRLDGSGVPTHVTAFASRPLDPNDDPHGRWAVVNTRYRNHPRVAHESTLSSSLVPKPRYIEPRRCSSIEHIEKAAYRAISEAMADFETYESTQRGWGDGFGRRPNAHIHAVNSVVRVRDDTLDPVLDQNMLVTRVAFHRSVGRGTLSTLRLVPLGAIEVFPPERS